MLPSSVRAVARPGVRRRLAAVTAGTAIALSVAALPGAFAEGLHHKKHQVEQKIGKAHQDADESSAALQAATAELERAQADLTTARDQLARTRVEAAAAHALDHKMQAALEQAQQRLEDAQAALAQGQADVAKQEDLVRQMVVSGYESGDPALMGLSMVLTTQDPAQLAGSLNSNSSVVNSQSVLLDHLEATKVVLGVKEADLATAEADVAEKRRAAAENLQRKVALEAQARSVEAQVTRLVDARTQARDAAMQAKSADLAELARLQVERDRIEAMIQRRASLGSGYTGGGKGFLDVPVPGPITSPFGWRIHPIYGYRSLHDGIDIGAACGTPITAPADGTVLSEYFQTAWGNRIIIDHGVHYGVGVATIANHLSGYAVTAGEHVTRGEVVGYVGTTGWSTGCHTHFTVLQNGVAVDPMLWF